MYVIGTAGHVDHGKSTLVQALTGIDPDRLKEEKERKMTIDLGFAWMHADNDGEEIGIVDVPGHRDFIENMLAGIGGIDLALFVIAADEGVMPQTKEHLAILDLLEVQGGIVALTKVDLVDDQDWLELVTVDISESLAGTVLEDAPIIQVSAKTGQGIDELRSSLLSLLKQTPSKIDSGRPRLSIDRVFSLSGFGTIVTGTLTGGRLVVGDAVEIQPGGLKGRIRGLQTHQTKRDVAFPGSRVAVNLTGLSKDEVKRGNVLAAPGVIDTTVLCDVSYRHLLETRLPLKHNVQVKMFTGSAEVVANTRVLGAGQIEPGETGWLQLILREPVALARLDRFILRRPSPGETIGGGQVLDPHPGRRHRRFRPEVLDRMETLAKGSPQELVLQAITRQEPVDITKAIRNSGVEPNTAKAALAGLELASQIIMVDNIVFSAGGWQRLLARLEKIVTDFHEQYPLRAGIPREELRSRLKITNTVFIPLLEQACADGSVAQTKTAVHLAVFQIRFNPEQEARVAELHRQFSKAGIDSPSVKDARALVGTDVFTALLDLGIFQQISDDVVYTTDEYKSILETIVAYIKRNGRINAAQLRDLMNTSRKYAIALLEHMDDARITRRVGDDRVLNERS